MSELKLNLGAREFCLDESLVMCACTTDGYETTEFIDPPTGCIPGDSVTFDGYPHKPEK